jgi:hypothetical protein
MSRPLYGHERTRGRRSVDVLAVYNPLVVARLLGLRKHTVEAILSRRMRPGPRWLAAVTRVTNPA